MKFMVFYRGLVDTKAIGLPSQDETTQPQLNVPPEFIAVLEFGERTWSPSMLSTSTFWARGIKVISATDLMVFKMLFDRSKDWVDTENLRVWPV